MGLAFHRMVLATAAMATMLLVACALGCTTEHRVEPTERIQTSNAAFNPTPTVGDFALYAQESLVVRTNGTVHAGDVGVKGATGPFLLPPHAVALETNAMVAPGQTVLADSVDLGVHASVGDIQTNHLTQAAAASHGFVAPWVAMPQIPATAPVQPGTTNVSVGVNATRDLSAGAYGQVTLATGARLRMAGGLYQFSSLSAGTNTRIEAQSPVDVRIAGKLATGTNATVGPAAGTTLTAKQVSFQVSGINGVQGGLFESPAAVQVGTAGVVRAVVLAPGGSIVLGTNTSVQGALVGRNIAVGVNAHVVFEDGLSAGGCSPPSCDDGNACTQDVCQADSCVHTPAVDGTACSDANQCTQTDSCVAGTCTGSNPVTCTALDQCHSVGTCNPSTGQCSNPNKTDGTVCSDGSACTQTDTCQAGTCTGTNPVTCAASDQCHDVGTCNPSTGQCSNPNKADGTACSDGDACTQTDACQAGTCTGSNPIACTASDQCHDVGTCSPSTGQCSNPNKTDGTLCSDGSACTLTDICQSGSCLGSNPVACIALDQCHVAGVCDPASGTCSIPEKPDGTDCSDGNACTQTDTCQAGNCAGANPVTCAASDQCHDVGTCNPSTGQCSNPNKADGTSCSDNSACTQTDRCQTGTCTGGNPVTCAALDACHLAGTCDVSTGSCSNPIKADGAVCDDGNACTTADTCSAGMCTGASAVVCAAQDNCHLIGTCNPTTGTCSQPAKPAGSPCDDGNACNGNETCNGSGQCQPGAPLNVNDGNPCTADSCDPAIGAQHTPVVAGTACGDGNACNGDESCNGAGQCQPGTTPTIDDGNPCTTDSCDPVAGVQHAPLAAGTPCADGNVCNGDEVCDGAGLCTAGAPAAIDDGDACTIDTCEPGGGIVHRACSALDTTVATTVYEATKFLFTGPNPVQTGVAADTISPVRVAVLRGRAMRRDGQPVVAARLSVVNHPEFGQSTTDGQGTFSMAVNGGGWLTVQYSATGYLPVYRKVRAPWQDYEWLPEVVMIGADPEVTEVNFQAPAGIQVARGSEQNDADGTRTATVLFNPGTTATVTPVGGSPTPVTSLHVRATEYTVGPTGPKAMPAELPANSGYTYAMELGADEAPGGLVQFSEPAYFYLENFPGFPVGESVPTGYYDSVREAWVASSSGRVIKILSITAGYAELDTDGDGAPDDATKLASLSITDGERERIGSLYAAGQTLWRVAITHFSSWDCNWGFGPPADAVSPSNLPPRDNQNEGDPNVKCGSIIECQNQILGEQVPVAGTGYSLHYESDRVLGRKASYQLTIPVSGPTLPASIKAIIVDIKLGGKHFGTVYHGDASTLANKTYVFDTWDGKDLFGRLMQGRQPVHVEIGYVYPGVYLQTSTFGYNGNGAIITGNSQKLELTMWSRWYGAIGAWNQSLIGLGGWSLSPQHGYDVGGKTLQLGGGERRKDMPSGREIRTFAGTILGFSGDGGPATAAKLNGPTGLAAGPDGSVFIAEQGRVRRVDPSGIISTFAGNGLGGTSSGDGGPALNARMNPRDVAVAPDGTVYITDFYNWRVRRVQANGIIDTFAGNGSPTSTGDGGPAKLAGMAPSRLTLGADGSMYIVDGHRIRRIDPAGIISTFAGNGGIGASGDFGQATLAQIGFPQQIAASPDGSLYIGHVASSGSGNLHRVRQVRPDGMITTIAWDHGSACTATSGDGGPVNSAAVCYPYGIAVGPDGTVYISDAANQRVRVWDSTGVINTLAGNGVRALGGDRGPAINAMLNTPGPLAVAPSGELYVLDTDNRRIRVIDRAFPGFSASDIVVPSDDAQELYVFNSLGRHLRTVDALTGAVRKLFAYDSQGRLGSVTDADGELTTIVRDAVGNPSQIVAPFGQTTLLWLNVGGWLSSVVNPSGESVGLTYWDNNGLLKTMVDERGGEYQFAYDPLGRLSYEQDPAGGFKALVYSEQSDGYTVTLTTAMGRATRYKVQNLSTGAQRRTNTFPDLSQNVEEIGIDRKHVATHADGTQTTTLWSPDPRFGMLAPVLRSHSTTTPAGLGAVATASRSVVLSDPSNPLTLQTLTESTSINGKSTTWVYNGAERSWTTTTPTGRTSSAVLDTVGRPTRAQVPLVLPIDVSYDAHGRPQSMTQGTRQLLFGYDASSGYLSSVTNPLTQTVGYSRDAVGRTRVQTLADLNIVQFGYDYAGNLISLTPPAKPAHNFDFTSVNLLQDYVPPVVAGSGANLTHYDYDLDQNLTSLLRPDLATISVGYDAQGRLKTTTIPGGLLTYGYSPTRGQLTSIAGPYGETITYGYDGRLLTDKSWTGTVAGAVHFDYNADYRIDTETVNGGNAVSYAYDNDGLMIGAGALTRTLDPQNGRLTGTALGTVTDAYGYDAYGALASYQSSSPYSAQFTRDALSRISTKTETTGGATHSYEYGYDARGRLTDVRKDGGLTAQYQYDANGNRLAETVSGKTATYDAQDRMLTYGGATYGYTANGELSTKSVGGQTTNYVYDVLGNLRSVALADGRSVEYVVDGVGRRVGKKVNGTLTKGWLYRSALQPVAELDGAGAVVGRFVYSTRVNVPEYMIKGGNTYRLIHDHLGSVRLVVDVATGTITQRIDYDAWGRVLSDTNPGFQPFGFAGGLYDPDTGLVRFGARDYDAETARWTGKDPVGFDGDSANLYGYGIGDPVNFIDPWGDDGEVANWVANNWWIAAVVPAAAPIAATVALVAAEAALDATIIGAIGTTFASDVTVAPTDWYIQGERNRTKKPDGTGNPQKKFRWDPKKQRWKYTDPNGKDHVKPPNFDPSKLTLLPSDDVCE